MLQSHQRRASSASAIERPKLQAYNSEIRARSAKAVCPSDHTFRIQSWLNEKSVRNIQVSSNEFVLFTECAPQATKSLSFLGDK